jgi:hypothetical protein
MANDSMRYDLLVQDALKGVVRKVLTDAARDGLPGDHHFYVSFRTDAPGVRVSPRLREKYPTDITIVLQHQFWDLTVTEQSFEVGLSFSGIPERLFVPFDALTGFFDPSVQFGLKFEPQVEGEAPAPAAQPEAPARPARGAGSEPQELAPRKPSVPATKSSTPKLPAAERIETGAKAGKPATEKPKPEPKPEAAEGGAEVVSLDSFRKKS